MNGLLAFSDIATMKSARIIAIVVFILGFLLNEWAFKFISPQPPIDSFMRLLVLTLDLFILVFCIAFLLRNISFSERLKTLLKNHPNSVLLFFGLFLGYCSIISVEFSCRYYFKHIYQAPYTEKTYWEPGAGERDSILGSKLFADTVITHAYVINDSLIYKQNYRTDKFRRRITPSVYPDSVYSNFAMVTGCSFAFGYGIGERETLGFYLDSLLGFRAYNYAVSGHGTQQTLALLQSRNLHDEIAEPNGILIHLFIDDHIKRLIGSRRLIKMWASHFPYYYLDGNELKRDGSFWTGRHLLSRFYRAISQSAFIDLFDIDIPWYVSNNHLKLFRAVITESKKEFMKQYPNGRFIVVIGPNSKLGSRVNSVLSDADIEVLNLTNLLNKEEKQYKIHWTEGHPNWKYYNAVAEEIQDYLNAEKR